MAKLAINGGAPVKEKFEMASWPLRFSVVFRDFP
jgi:hypothetical protein